MGGLRSLTYRSGLLAMARSLHLTDFLRTCYYRWSVSSEGVFKVKAGGIDTRFYAHSAEELRQVEEGIVAEPDFFQALLKGLSPGDTFFDVGAEIGKFVIPLAKVVGEHGQVIAFEPAARSYQRLLNHVKLNQLSNVTVYRQALGEQNVGGRIFVGGGACPSMLAHAGDSEQQKASEEIEVVQGDAFVAAEKLPVPRAIKIDVEGYEFSVLRGLKQTLANPACTLLCCEIHPLFLPPEVTTEMITDFVKSLGFSRIEINPWRSEVHLIATKI